MSLYRRRWRHSAAQLRASEGYVPLNHVQHLLMKRITHLSHDHKAMVLVSNIGPIGVHQVYKAFKLLTGQ